MFWKNKKQPSSRRSDPLGVPLADLAGVLNEGGLKTSIDGHVMLVEHKHFTTRVEVLPADAGSESEEPIQAVVRVTTQLPDTLQAMFGEHGLALQAAFNPMASLGALTLENKRLFIGSRLTIYEGEGAWDRLHFPMLSAAILRGPDAILGAIRRSTSGEEPCEGQSNWGEVDFSAVHSVMERLCSCTMSATGFTAEFPLEEGAVSAALGHQATALFQLQANQSHPELGGGLFCLLSLPHKLPSADVVANVCRAFNQSELLPRDAAPHFGAWCPGRMGSNVAYASFLPNFLHVVPGLALNMTSWALARSHWADDVLRQAGAEP